MKPELSWRYLQSIEPDPIQRLIRMNAEAWVENWKASVDAAVNSDLVGDALYEAFPSAYTIPVDEWEAKLQANWARLAEYDRLTAERKGRND